jgi:hypothetical protein
MKMEDEELERKIENFLRGLLKGYISEWDLTALLNCVEELQLIDIQLLIKRRIDDEKRKRSNK